MEYYPEKIEVEWWAGSQKATKPQVKKCRNLETGSTSFSLTSQLEVDVEEWHKGTKYTCKAIHKSKEFSSATSVCFAYPISSPSVHLEKPCIENNEITVTCVVVAFYKTIIFWIINNQTTSQKIIKPTSDQTHSFNSTLTFSKEEWKMIKTITCRVEHQCFPRKEETITLTGEPSVKLFQLQSAQESNFKTLVCLGSGINPQIKWFSEFAMMEATASKTSTEANDQITVFSQLEFLKEDWIKGVVVTCKVNDPPRQKVVSKNISKCTETPTYLQKATVFLLGPSLNDKLNLGDLPVTCQVIGYDVTDFSISWRVNGITLSQKADRKPHSENANGTQTVYSVLNITQHDWQAHSSISCQVKHLCSNDFQEKQLQKVKSEDLKQPAVQIFKPFDAELTKSGNASLLCVVSGFSPPDIEVYWELDGRKLGPSQYTSSPVLSSGGSSYSVYSWAPATRSEWREGLFSCVVRHESVKELINHTVTNAFDTVEEDENINDNANDLTFEDNFQEIWSTVWVFFVLFVISLLYSSFVTFVKVK